MYLKSTIRLILCSLTILSLTASVSFALTAQLTATEMKLPEPATIVLSPNGEQYVALAKDGVWYVNGSEKVLICPITPYTTSCFDPSGRKIAILDYDSKLRVWSTEAKRFVAEIGYPYHMSGLFWSHDGRRIFITSFEDKQELTRVISVDTHSWKTTLIKTLKGEFSHQPVMAREFRDWLFLLEGPYAGPQYRPAFLELKTGRLFRYNYPMDRQHWLMDWSISPDGKRFVTQNHALPGAPVQIVELGSWQVLYQVTGLPQLGEAALQWIAEKNLIVVSDFEKGTFLVSVPQESQTTDQY